jgi:hypothetical protein
LRLLSQPRLHELLNQPLQAAGMAIDKVQRQLHQLIVLARAARLLTERACNLIEKSHACLPQCDEKRRIAS